MENVTAIKDAELIREEAWIRAALVNKEINPAFAMQELEDARARYMARRKAAIKGVANV